MSALLYRNPRLLILGVVLLVAGGWAATSRLPRLEDPPFVERWSYVTTTFPGAGAERVELLVTEPLEHALQEMGEVEMLNSTSRAGVSTIRIRLVPRVADVEPVWSKVRDRLEAARARLPDGAGAPDLDKEAFQVATIQLALVWHGDEETPRSVLTRLALELEQILRSLGDTAHTEIFGGSREQMLVELDAARLESVGLTVEDVARQIRDSDATVPSGQLKAGDEVLPFAVGSGDETDRLRHVPVSGGGGGQTLRLAEIAGVRRAVAEPPAELALVDGRDAVVVAARMARDVRGDRWVAEVEDAIRGFRDRLPGNIELRKTFDQTRYTGKRLAALVGNLLLGAMLVVVVALVMLGWRSMLLVLIAMPLTCAAALMVFGPAGLSLEQMSITGLIIALGLLIDNAIVVVDEVQRRMRAGEPGEKALKSTSRKLFAPLLASTLTTVFALAPLVLMEGPTGDFLSSLGLSLIFALLLSLMVALVFIAPMRVWLGRGGSGPWSTGVSIPWLGRRYDRLVTAAAAHPVHSILLATAFPLAGFLGARHLPEQFFPPADRDQIEVQLTLSPQSSIQKTRETVARAETILRSRPALGEVHWFLGRSAPMFYYNTVGGRAGTPSFAHAMVRLSSTDDVTATVRELQRALDDELTEAESLVLQLEQGPAREAPVEICVIGPDLATVDTLGRRIRGVMAKAESITHARTSIRHGQPLLVVDANADALTDAGSSPRDVAHRLHQGLEGLDAGVFLDGPHRLPVRVRLRDADRSSLSAVETMGLLPSGDRASAPDSTSLSGVGEVELRPDWSQITRRNRTRCNTVQGFIPAGTLPSAALGEVMAGLDAEGFTPPPGYRVLLGGEADERDKAVEGLMTWVLPLLLLLFATIVLSFRSFRCALIIAAVGVASVGLALVVLLLFGYPLGFMAILGTVGLIGVAVNDAIVVLTEIRHDPAARAGDPAAIGAVVSRSTRHVLTTTITTMAGFAPLIIAGGDFWPPMAIVIAAGLAGATVLSLTFVPACHRLFVREKAA